MKMKNIVKVLAILLFTIIMAGCSSDDEDKANIPLQPAEVTTTAVRKAPVPEPSKEPLKRAIPEYLPEQLEYFGKMPFEMALTFLDINHDRIIDVQDVRELLQALKQHQTRPQMDIDQDGTINTLDADLLSMLAGDGEALPNGALDANYDKSIDASDYQINEVNGRILSLFYDEKTAKSLIGQGTQLFSVPASRFNLNYIDADDETIWRTLIKLRTQSLQQVSKEKAKVIRQASLLDDIAATTPVWLIGAQDNATLTILLDIEQEGMHLTLPVKQRVKLTP